MGVKCSICGNDVSDENAVCGVCAVKTVVENNKVGNWEINPDGYYPECSICKYEPRIDHCSDLYQYHYCPNCGSPMEKFRYDFY